MFCQLRDDCGRRPSTLATRACAAKARTLHACEKRVSAQNANLAEAATRRVAEEPGRARQEIHHCLERASITKVSAQERGRVPRPRQRSWSGSAMTTSTRLAAILLLSSASAACEEPPGSEQQPDEPSPAAASSGEDAPDRCAPLQREAVALWRAHQHCKQDADCTSVKIEPACVDPLVCRPSVSRLFDVAAFQAKATDIALRYRDCVGECEIFECAESDGQACDPVRQVCVPVHAK